MPLTSSFLLPLLYLYCSFFSSLGNLSLEEASVFFDYYYDLCLLSFLLRSWIKLRFLKLGKRKILIFRATLQIIHWEIKPSLAIQLTVTLTWLYYSSVQCYYCRKVLPKKMKLQIILLVSEMFPRSMFPNTNTTQLTQIFFSNTNTTRLALIRISIPFSGLIKDIFTQDKKPLLCYIHQF